MLMKEKGGTDVGKGEARGGKAAGVGIFIFPTKEEKIRQRRGGGGEARRQNARANDVWGVGGRGTDLAGQRGRVNYWLLGGKIGSGFRASPALPSRPGVGR